MPFLGNVDLQAIAAPAIVLIAVAYLARLLVRKWFGASKPGAKAGCGSCCSCPSTSSLGRPEPNVVEIGLTITRAGERI